MTELERHLLGLSLPPDALDAEFAAASKPPEKERTVSPLALRRADVMAALGISEETFDKHVRATLPVVRLGSLRLYPADAITEWLREHATSPMQEVDRG